MREAASYILSGGVLVVLLATSITAQVPTRGGPSGRPQGPTDASILHYYISDGRPALSCARNGSNEAHRATGLNGGRLSNSTGRLKYRSPAATATTAAAACGLPYLY